MRRYDWEERLHDLIVENRDRAHEFGVWDCLLWPAAAVKAITGRDFARGHRRKYKSVASAYQHLKRMGFDSPEALLDSLFEEKPVGFAQRGDLVLVRTLSGDNPGVCVGHFVLVVGEEGSNVGLVRAPREWWLKAWRVD